MEVLEALAVLGLAHDASWDAARQAHRVAIRAAHPDAGGSGGEAARINQALDVLRAASDAGERAFAVPEPTRSASPSVTHRPAVDASFELEPHELLMRLADVAHDVGEVVFVDPVAGLLEVIVGVEPAVGQLTAALDDSVDEGTPIVFTLEALGSAPAPPIETVVADLLRRFRYETRDPD
jgi:hypothetical protein